MFRPFTRSLLVGQVIIRDLMGSLATGTPQRLSLPFFLTRTRTMEDAVAPLLDDSDDEVSVRLPPSRVGVVLQFLIKPLTDDKGTPSAVISGLATLSLAGILMGTLSTKNHDLNGWWYPFVSAMIGYTYFFMWSVSFYPQVVINYRRRTTRGLSRDFCFLNLFGFACYATYNLALFYNTTARDEYSERHNGGAVPVQSNDVAFSVHALVLSAVTLCQIIYYDGFQMPSRIVGVGMLVLVLFIGLFGILVASHRLPGLDLLYVLSYIKMGITIIKYIPQVVLNFRRRSTAGWSVWQILLDFGGGTLSDAQLALDCHNLHDWTGLTGNLAKLTLGMVSIVFDVIFLMQHYVLYPNSDDAISTPVLEEEAPLNEESNVDTSDNQESPAQLETQESSEG